MKSTIATLALAALTSQIALAQSSQQKNGATSFLANHCTKCHGPTRQAAKLDLRKIGNLADGEDVGHWQRIMERLKAGEMPPKKEPRPKPAELQSVITWISHGLEQAAKNGIVAGVPAEAHAPGKGNLVDHDLLFHSDKVYPLDAPPRLWRISSFIYDGLVNDITRNRIKIANPFAMNSKGGFLDYAHLFTISEPSAVQLIRNAKAIVAYQCRTQLRNGKLRSVNGSVREFAPLMDTKNPPTDALMTNAIRAQFERVLLRPPTKMEAGRFLGLMKKNIKDAGQIKGVQTTLAAILLLPDVLYRSELGQGPPDAQGRLRLSPREIAFAVAYALTDDRPDRKLLEAAAKGNLDTRAGVKEQIERLWKDPKTKKPRILRFFREYFRYGAAIQVFKDKKDLKTFNGTFRANILVADTDQLIEFILEKDQNVLYELLTTNKSFVNTRYDRKRGYIKGHNKNPMNLAYNVPNNKWTNNQPMTLSSKERAGILTQPSWLVANSTGSDNHAILRGKWVREKLLGGAIPDLPITVDAQLPEDETKTLRQRMMVTQKSYCWQCHQKMNPLGLSFEMYDHLGQYRTEELGKAVDASGSIDKSGEKDLEGKVNGAVEMLHGLAKSERVKQVFVRHAFRFWMGRNETYGDARTLREAYLTYNKSGGSMKALVVSLLTSEAFLYRASPSKSVQRN